MIPNIAASLTSSDDSRVHTFKLREGMKWSDGAPFTAQDIVFWWDDIAQEPKLPADFKPRAVQGAGKLKVEALDDYTVRFTFEKPNGLFPQMLATMDGEYMARFPAHYLKQFMPKYNPNADALAKAGNFPDWAAMVEQKSNVWLNPEKPTIFAWKVVQPISDTRRVILERNPYYWKINSAGEPTALPRPRDLRGRGRQGGHAPEDAQRRGRLPAALHQHVSEPRGAGR